MDTYKHANDTRRNGEQIRIEGAEFSVVTSEIKMSKKLCCYGEEHAQTPER